MVRVWGDGPLLRVETDRYFAAVNTKGYVTGVRGGSFVDKATGMKDLGFGLVVVDFLLEPGADDETTPPNLRYPWGDKIHGNIPKRYVALPQICTRAKDLPVFGGVQEPTDAPKGVCVVRGDDFVAVCQWFTWTIARPPYKPGSRWEQWLVFPRGVRWFLAYDKVTSANTVPCLLLRMDMPGHIKHEKGDTFRQVYLSYLGIIPADAFFEDFPPDARYLYRRGDGQVPDRFIRAYQGRNGVWLAGMALSPSVVYEAWCHQRGYVCLIQEIGGKRIEEGERIEGVHLIGFFDDLAEAERVFDAFKGATVLRVGKGRWELDG